MSEKNKNNIKNEENKEEYKPVLAVIDDIPQIKQLGASFWGREGIYSDKFYMNTLKQNLSYVYKEKIRNRNILIAICLVDYDETTNFVGIDLMCVNKDYQGKGFGKALLSFCINNCIEKGYIKFYLHVATTNKKAIGLYKKLGFYIAKFVANYYCNDKPPDNDAYLMKLYKNKKLEEFKPKIIGKSKEKEEKNEKEIPMEIIRVKDNENSNYIEKKNEKSRTNYNFYKNNNNYDDDLEYKNNTNYNNYDYYRNNYNYYDYKLQDDRYFREKNYNNGYNYSDYRTGYYKRLNHYFSY